MGFFDRKIEKKSANKMTREQKIRQNYAIINYYKKKEDSTNKDQKNIKKRK